MEIIKNAFSSLGEVIDLIGILILLYGFVKNLIKYITLEFIKFPFKAPTKLLQKLRCDIAIYILLALDFLIASDIIHTIQEITQTELIELGLMIALRTAIGYFLGKEINEIHEEKGVNMS